MGRYVIFADPLHKKIKVMKSEEAFGNAKNAKLISSYMEKFAEKEEIEGIPMYVSPIINAVTGEIAPYSFFLCTDKDIREIRGIGIVFTENERAAEEIAALMRKSAVVWKEVCF